MCVIYKIRNVVNGHFYVGSTVNSRVRFQTHRRQLRKGNHHCISLQRAWEKYSEECFKFEVIETVTDAGQLATIENQWLEANYGQPHCYNTGVRAGAAFLGRSHTAEAIAKVSRAQIGKQHRLGQSNSPEHRAKISMAMTGKRKSAEHADKIRQRMIGTSYAKGRVVTDEERARRGRAVIEVTTGLHFITAVAAAEHFGLHRANLIRALRTDAPLKRGPSVGLHFRYTLPPPPE